jgi:LysR family transcriptional regulator of abg operon
MRQTRLAEVAGRYKVTKGYVMHPKLSLNFNHLQHFLAIADHGSLRAAANVLGLSQPAVSKSLRSLEGNLGAPLIQRNARGSTLTPFGELLYSRARLIGNEMERVVDDIHQLAGVGQGKVTLGASAIPSLLLIPAAVARFNRDHQDIGLDLVGGMPSVLLPRLCDGSLDFVVGPRPTVQIPEQIEAVPLFTTPSCIVVQKGHPLERAKSIREFNEAEWVLSSGAAHAESALHTIFSKYDLLKAKIVIRVESLFAAYSFVATTRYVGLMPRHSTRDSLIFHNISFVEVPELKITESYVLFKRRDAPQSSAAKMLIAEIKAQAQCLRDTNSLIFGQSAL